MRSSTRTSSRFGTGSALTAVALVLVGGVTGCASGEQTADPSETSTTATPTPTATPSPTTPSAEPSAEPSASPSVDAQPAVDALVLSTAGLGPLTIGLPPETNPGAAMIVFDPEACVGFDDPMGRGPGRWAADYPPFVDAEGNERPQFWLDANDADGVYWIDVIDPRIRTAAGVGVGSTLAELQAVYPDLEAGTPGPGTQPWWVSDDAGTLVFEVSDAPQPPATTPGVVIIHVQGPDTDPDWTSANTDLVAGGCL